MKESKHVCIPDRVKKRHLKSEWGDGLRGSTTIEGLLKFSRSILKDSMESKKAGTEPEAVGEGRNICTTLRDLPSSRRCCKDRVHLE